MKVTKAKQIEMECFLLYQGFQNGSDTRIHHFHKWKPIYITKGRGTELSSIEPDLIEIIRQSKR